MGSVHLLIVCLLFHFSISVRDTNSTSLRLVQVLFRHGDRTPTETYKNDPYQHWTEGWGSLTNNGKTQMYKLGQLLRETYKNYLSEYYFPDNLYVRSSYADRCLMSAQALLAGLFPPVREQIWNPNLLWQPIPVNYYPRSEDNVIVMKKNCPAYTAALKSAYQSERIQNIDKTNKDLYEYLTIATGGQLDNINAVEYLYNTLEIEMQNNLSLPAWTRNVSMDKLLEIAKLNYAIFTDTTLMKRLSGGSFLNEILAYITKKVEQKSKLEMILYSAHDVTIATVTRTLGFEEFLKPEYGAYLLFELHHINLDNYELRLLYGKNFETVPKQIEMKSCPSPCMLKDFVHVLQPVLPTDWEGECLQ